MTTINSTLSSSIGSRTVFDTLTFLPNPTKSKQQREAYIKYVVPSSIMCLLACAAPAYGFNVWLLPVSLSLYGPDAIYSMSDGIILYSFSCQTLMCGLMMEALSSKMRQWKTGVACAAAIVIYPLGLVISGLSLQYASGSAAEAGFFLSQCLGCGTGLALAWYPAQIGTVMWFREIGRPSVGAGLFGFFLGFWPMTFSWWGSVLVRDDIHISFYITAAVIFLVSLSSIFLFRSPAELPLLEGLGQEGGNNPSDVEVQAESGQHNVEEQSAKNKETVNTAGLTEAASPLLTRSQFNRQPQAYIQFFVWIFTAIPGFAIKFTISPIMSSVFGASVKLQNTASFIFLFFYAISRLLTGLVIGRVTLRTVLMTSTIVSFPCFFFVGAIVFKGWTSVGWMWGFIAANIAVASSLGVEKVLISLVCLANWGVNNMPRMTARAVFAMACAAFIGPLFIWLGLSYPGNIYLDPTLNTSVQQKEELEQSMGAALLVLGAVGFVGFVGHWLCVKPYKPSTRRVDVEVVHTNEHSECVNKSEPLG